LEIKQSPLLLAVKVRNWMRGGGRNHRLFSAAGVIVAAEREMPGGFHFHRHFATWLSINSIKYSGGNFAVALKYMEKY